MSMHDDLPITVEEWDDAESRIVEVLARCANTLIGRGAFEAAVAMRTNRRILLCDRARVIARYVPET
jgi:hypothetical protein